MVKFTGDRNKIGPGSGGGGFERKKKLVIKKSSLCRLRDIHVERRSKQLGT